MTAAPNIAPLIIIPARMASSRLPGKPLADIGGLPLIGHVWGRAVAARVGDVVVAAGDTEIVDAVRALGGDAVLTDRDLPSGTDRVRAAAEMVDPEGKRAVVNLQGDMPDVGMDVLRAVVERLEGGAEMVTAVVAVEGELGPDRVKAVVAEDGRALYFSRAEVPFDASGGEGPRMQHVGIYGFSRAGLARFCALEPSALERRERLEQLRALEAGMRIDCVEVASVPMSVDTPGRSGAGEGEIRMKIVYQGEPGAYSHLACVEHYPDYAPEPCASFRDAFEAVQSGRGGACHDPGGEHAGGAGVRHLPPVAGGGLEYHRGAVRADPSPAAGGARCDG